MAWSKVTTDLFNEMARRGVSVDELSAWSGVGTRTIISWVAERNPSLQNIEACWNALGFNLVPVKEEDDE